jgi:hypothetical protein
MHPLLIAHVRSVAAAAVESGQAFTRYKAHNTRHVQGEAAIMQEILVSGPVMQEILVSGPVDVTFNVYSDFQPYCSERLSAVLQRATFSRTAARARARVPSTKRRQAGGRVFTA